jgi:hypothetical protein
MMISVLAAWTWLFLTTLSILGIILENTTPQRRACPYRQGARGLKKSCSSSDDKRVLKVTFIFHFQPYVMRTSERSCEATERRVCGCRFLAWSQARRRPFSPFCILIIYGVYTVPLLHLLYLSQWKMRNKDQHDIVSLLSLLSHAVT